MTLPQRSRRLSCFLLAEARRGVLGGLLAMTLGFFEELIGGTGGVLASGDPREDTSLFEEPRERERANSFRAFLLERVKES